MKNNNRGILEVIGGLTLGTLATIGALGVAAIEAGAEAQKRLEEIEEQEKALAIEKEQLKRLLRR